LSYLSAPEPSQKQELTPEGKHFTQPGGLFTTVSAFVAAQDKPNREYTPYSDYWNNGNWNKK